MRNWWWEYGLHVGALGIVGMVLQWGVSVEGALPLAVGGLLLLFAKRVIRPLLFVLTLPLTLVSLGLFVLVLNGWMLWLAAALVPGIEVHGWIGSVFGAVSVSFAAAVGRRLVWSVAA